MVRFALEKSSYIKPSKSIVYNGNRHITQTKKQFWLSKFVEFCKRTDLHGYKYIVMEDFNYVERSCWALAVLVSIALAAYFVVTAYKWYARNPIVTVIESTQGAIWDVPFPAITICDLNVISKKAAREFANNLTLPENVTADSVFETLSLVPVLYSTFKARPAEKEQLYQLQTILELNNITIIALFKQLSPASSCTQLIQKCMWKSSIYRCEELFRHIITILSFCCTFNYFAFHKDKDLSLLAAESHFNTPRRVASCGYQTALTVLLNTNPDDYHSAAIASQGVLVMIENAYNIPDFDSPVRMVTPSTEVLIALSPEWTYTTSGVKSFSPEERQCYYSDEIQVGEFRQYSFHNCMAYQKVEIVKRICDCVPLFFPIAAQDRVCTFKDMNCMENIYLNEIYSRRNGSWNGYDFKCLPECEHYDYPMEIALGKLADTVHVKGLPFFDNVNLLNRSLLNVFFNDLVSTRYRRDVYLNWQNILAAFGGLLSLMLGFTLISGVDLLLFFTIRIAYNSCATMYVAQPTRNKINVQEYHKKDGLTSQVYNQKAFKIYGSEFVENGRY